MPVSVPAAMTSHTAKQDFAQDKQAKRLQEINTMCAGKQCRHKPIPQHHYYPAQGADADNSQYENLQKSQSRKH
ncbi:hypothetical protein ABTD44_19420, partial [Acinetobacter baumannii]